jgi:hypothetical protein
MPATTVSLVSWFRQIRQSPSQGSMGEMSLALWCPAMDEWIREHNIAEFQKQLSQTTDPDQRRILLQLLAAERANASPPKAANDDRLNWIPILQPSA